MTHAADTFRDKSLREYLDDLPEEDFIEHRDNADPAAVDETSFSALLVQVNSEERQFKKVSVKRFIKLVNERVMAVANNCETEYEKQKQREALMNLIDVVLRKNDGKCFTYKYYDKIEQVLKDKAAGEETAKQDILQREKEECNKARKSVDQAARAFAEEYLKSIQYSIFENGRPSIDEIFTFNLKELKIGIAGMLELIEDEKRMDPITNIVNLIDMRKTSKERGQRTHGEGLQLLIDTKTVMERFGLNQVQCETAIEYCIQISSLLFDLSKEEKKDIDLQDAVTDHLQALLEAYTVMERTTSSGTIQAMKEDVEFKLIPLIMSEISDENETGTWIEKRKTHQKEALKISAEERKNPGRDRTFLGRYRRETEFLRRYATVVADEKISKMSQKDEEMLTSSIYNDFTSPVLRNVVAEVKNKISLNVEAVVGAEESLTFISSVSPDLIMKIVKETVVDILIQQTSEKRGKGFELQRTKLRMKSIGRQKYPEVSKVNELLKVNRNRKDTKSYDDAMLYIVNTVEFLVERCFRKIRIEVLQKEDSNTHSEGRRHIKEIAKSAVYFQLAPLPKDVIFQNSLDKQCKMGIWELEVDLQAKEKLQKEREKLRYNVRQHEKYLQSYIEDLVELLTSYVRDETMKYARSKTKQKLIAQRLTKYEGTANELLPRVKAQLSEEAVAYFGDKKIKDAITTYAKLNHSNLFKLAQVCFPAETKVMEEKRGEICISDVKIGDRLLTVLQDGTTGYEDVFMFGTFSCLSLI